MSKLIAYISSLEVLTENEAAQISVSFTASSLKAGDCFLREGQACKQVAFVEKGLLMYSKITEKGQEVVCDFAKEGDWVTQYQSFIAQSKSPLSIKAIEPCLLQVISFNGLMELYANVPTFERVARRLIDQVFINMVKRSGDLQMLKAEERYAKFRTEQPDILQRAPQYLVASFLGVAPQSLSRIRKNS